MENNVYFCNVKFKLNILKHYDYERNIWIC